MCIIYYLNSLNNHDFIINIFLCKKLNKYYIFYIKTTQSLHNRYTTATRPLHDRYTNAT